MVILSLLSAHTGWSRGEGLCSLYQEEVYCTLDVKVEGGKKKTLKEDL
jgi:hypothetical protein